jgi:TetR/AcrR family transcriptional regulator
MPRPRSNRRQEILQTLAAMLEQTPGGRITTATLAAQVGVSEAALYRHFPSKARMLEGLIEYTEETLFSRISRIIESTEESLVQCEQILYLFLAFVEKNPGISRLLNGDALTGETDRLRQRVSQIFDRLETQLRQIFREAEINEARRTQATVTSTAGVLLAFVEGKLSQFVRSDFRLLPTSNWPEQWGLLRGSVYR